MFDSIIRNAEIVDGSGAAAYRADVAVRDGRIAAIGELGGDARKVIDARGLVCAPGFIDMHSHTDLALFVDPRSESKITQGITTEICGNCGFSAAPCAGEVGRSELDHWRRAHGIGDDWQDLRGMLAALERHRIGINFATLIGHSNLRAATVGLGSREASPEEINEMQALATEAMAHGAFGLSSGLAYPPSCYAGTAELIELSKAVAACGGIYVTHIRDEHDGIIEAVEEAIEIGRASGAGVHISHHKACGRTNWGKVKYTLEIIDKSRNAGMDVTVDQYPYTASSTSLGVVMPDWAHDGGPEALLERLVNQRKALIGHLENIAEPAGWLANDGGWGSVVVSGVRTQRNRHCEGMTIESIAHERGCEPSEVVLDLLMEERLAVGVVIFAQCEEDIETIMRSESVMFGTDSSARSITGELSKGKPHPRAYGSFPRVLSHYVRERGVISIETAIRKMTSAPARKLGIADRGLIKEGFWADLVVFDPESITDKATYENPHQISAGIKYVFVNGVLSAKDGELTGALAGQVLRGSCYKTL